MNETYFGFLLLIFSIPAGTSKNEQREYFYLMNNFILKLSLIPSFFASGVLEYTVFFIIRIYSSAVENTGQLILNHQYLYIRVAHQLKNKIVNCSFTWVIRKTNKLRISRNTCFGQGVPDIFSGYGSTVFIQQLSVR